MKTNHVSVENIENRPQDADNRSTPFARNKFHQIPHSHLSTKTFLPLTKYPLTSKNSPPIFQTPESKVLSKTAGVKFAGMIEAPRSKL